jgi:hypothetical protein
VATQVTFLEYVRVVILSRVLLAAALAASLTACSSEPTVAELRSDSSAARSQVLVISVDALNPDALRRLGPEGAPSFHRLMDEGASTLNARSQVELTKTLPNHTSMVTGRRIDPRQGGHGVDWNVHVGGTTVRKAAGERVDSIFSVVHRAGLDSALFATKQKFSLFARSWPSIDEVTVREGQDAAVTTALRSDLVEHDRDFTFVHLGAPDRAGHAHGFMSSSYLGAVRRTDALLGSVLATIDEHDALDDLVVVLTSDHGGLGHDHDDPTSPANYRVPFMAWGHGVGHGNLYGLNPAFARPGNRRVGFAAKQPIRNGDVANLSARLLGLDPVPDSLWDADQRLRLR